MGRRVGPSMQCHLIVTVESFWMIWKVSILVNDCLSVWQLHRCVQVRFRIVTFLCAPTPTDQAILTVTNVGCFPTTLGTRQKYLLNILHHLVCNLC